MPLSVPQSVNFTDPLNAVSIDTYNDPRDGRRIIPIELAWQTALAKNLSSFSINLQNNATLEFSKISGLVVDNSLCGTDLDLIFPDIAVTITIPAYSPYNVLPVFSNQEQFWIKARGAINGDITYIGVLNFAPDPIAVPITIQQKNAVVASANIVNGNTQLVAAGVNGTLQALNVNVNSLTPPANFTASIQIKDGTGALIWSGNVSNTTTGNVVAELVSINGLNIRFVNGLIITIGGAAAASGQFNVNAGYITP